MVQGRSRRKTQIAHNKNLIKSIKKWNKSSHWIYSHLLFMIKLIDMGDWINSYGGYDAEKKIKEIELAIRFGNILSDFYVDYNEGADVVTKYKDFIEIENGDIKKTLANLANNFYSYVAKHITNWYE